jgi:hypothetical protein
MAPYAPKGTNFFHMMLSATKRANRLDALDRHLREDRRGSFSAYQVSSCTVSSVVVVSLVMLFHP